MCVGFCKNESFIIWWKVPIDQGNAIEIPIGKIIIRVGSWKQEESLFKNMKH